MESSDDPGPGYYRYPDIRGDRIVFACEDDLWLASSDGGWARRLTAGRAEASHPRLSPDARWVAFTGREEGAAEVYVVAVSGGPPRRLTFDSATICRVVGWLDERRIVFQSSAGKAFFGQASLCMVPVGGGSPKSLGLCAESLAITPDGRRIVGRTPQEPGNWKGYRGGAQGTIWLETPSRGWVRLLGIEGNPSGPMVVGSRVFFLSDHEGTGNLFSCDLRGEGLERHTEHRRFHARNASSDGRRVIYPSGGRLFLFDPERNESRQLDLRCRRSGEQRQRRFAYAQKHLEGFDLHPSGALLGVVVRGKLQVGHPFRGPVRRLGEADGVRYRQPKWLPGGRCLAALGDRNGADVLFLFDLEADSHRVLELGEVGRIDRYGCSPDGGWIALGNHRAELFLVRLADGEARLVDHGRKGDLSGFAWSPDSRWLAYDRPLDPRVSEIVLHEVASGQSVSVTEPVLRDLQPCFDPGGRFLCFLSYRELEPVYDALKLDLAFPQGCRPYRLRLRQDPDESRLAAEDREAIDLCDMPRRLESLPVPAGRYSRLWVLAGHSLALIDESPGADSGERALRLFDLRSGRSETLAGGVGACEATADGCFLVYRCREGLRVLRFGEEEAGSTGEGQWVDSSRFRVAFEPAAEWEQIYHETWRQQRDHFWRADMGGVDWPAIAARYADLLPRIGSRSELTDVLSEMLGELGTSHAFEQSGGDLRAGARYGQGFLGADFELEATGNGYRITHIPEGDAWNPGACSPLARSRVPIRPGDVLLAIDGEPLSWEITPGRLLVNRVGEEVELLLRRAGKEPWRAVVSTLESEAELRYRDWVIRNRQAVHRVGRGRVGYLHIPDMGPRGYAELYRGFWLEMRRDALLVDVRFNSGGHVGAILLGALAQRRIGFCLPRWGDAIPYPGWAFSGPLVALVNEHTCSDGERFAQGFRSLGLGPLVGSRTWGGVMGVTARPSLVDGGRTLQPEFGFWIEGLGWSLENRGVSPDLEASAGPEASEETPDPQLALAIREAERLLRKEPKTERPSRPEVGEANRQEMFGAEPAAPL